MSKIYEALLRAEQERADGKADESNVASPRVPVSVEILSVGALPEPVSHIRPEYVPPSSGFAMPMEPAAPAFPAASAPVANLENPSLLQKAPDEFSIWHPDMAKLPALEARGNQVEQFRSLRSKLFEFRDLNKLKSIMVSSGLPAEGKSFVTTNLAITFALHKSARVLLIDSDLRRSTQHKSLGAPNAPGLAEYLAGKASLNEIMRRGISGSEEAPLHAGLSTLSFIAAGEAGDKAADLSGSPRFAALMEAASAQFDWIILDSSPVNLVTDAVNFARSCDGVLLIARAGVTKYEAVQRAMAELKASKVLGMVLNAVEDPPTADGYYGYDNYDSLKA